MKSGWTLELIQFLGRRIERYRVRAPHTERSSAAKSTAHPRRPARPFLIALLTTSPLLAAMDCGTPSQLYIQEVRDVCHLPRPNNNGKVLGHDVGWSVRRDPNNTIWLFGDTWVDKNGDGLMGGPGEFRTGTIAKSIDNDPSDCIDLTYKTDAEGFADVALAPKLAEKECLTWPSGGVVRPSDKRVYITYTSVRKPNGCGPSTEGPTQYHTGLAKLTSVTNLTLVRVQGTAGSDLFWTHGQPQFQAPIQVGGHFYFFASHNLEHVKVARVPIDQVETFSAYRYFAGAAGWSPDVNAAKPIFSRYTTATPNISFDPNLNRFVAIYNCDYSTSVCGRTAKLEGETEAALVGEWLDHKPIQKECGSKADPFRCYQSFLHDAYRTGAPDEPVYVSTARFKTDIVSKRYWVTLREYKLGATPPPANRTFYNAESQYSYWPNRFRWRNQTEAGGDLTFASGIWQGDEPGGLPEIQESNVKPGTFGADRVWYANQAGMVRFSGEAWIERTCSSGVDLWVDQLSGGATVNHYYRRIVPGESALVNGVNIPVVSGDKLRFRVGPAGSTNCDLTYWNPTLTFDGVGEFWKASEDFIDSRPNGPNYTLNAAAQGYRGWRYEECEVGPYLTPLNCQPLETWLNDPNGGAWHGATGQLWFVGGIPPNNPNLEIARSWTAPRAGTAHVSMAYYDDNTCPGNQGANLALFKNATPLWIEPMAEGAALETAEIDVVVKKGDVLRFILHQGPDSNACDQAIFIPSISMQ